MATDTRAEPDKPSEKGSADGPENGTGTGPDLGYGRPAAYGRRFCALLIDWLLCLMLAGLFSKQPATGFWAYPLLTLEYAFFVGLYGQTVGMKLSRIRCVAVGDGGRLGVPRALLRGFLLCLIVPPLVIGPGGRGWHDRAAGSIVVQD